MVSLRLVALTFVAVAVSGCELSVYNPVVTRVGDPVTPGDRQSGDGSVGGDDASAGDPRAGDPETKLTNGSFCIDGGECQSTICIDSVCCVEACDDVCEQCDGTGTCVAEVDDDACLTVDCDGLDSACRDYDDPVERCAGRGMCKLSNTSDCTDYLDSSNVTPCNDDDPGTAPDLCNGTGSCIGTPVVLADVGAFSITTGGVGSMVPVTGVGFQPKVLLLWWSGRTEDPTTVTTVSNRMHFRRGFGFTIGPGQSRLVTAQSENNTNPSDADRMHREDACVGSLNRSGAIDGLAELVSFDSDGFTLEIVFDPFDENLTVTYLALGGAEITDAAVGTFTAPDTPPTATQEITGVGFEPELVLFLNGTIRDPPPAIATYGNVTIGAAVGPADEQNVVAGAVAEHGSDPPRSRGYGLHSESVVSLSSTGNNPYERGKLDAFLADGFRINWLEIEPDVADTWHYFYLAIRGGNPRVGTLVTLDNVDTDMVISGVGYKPAGTLLVTRGEDEDSPDSQSTRDYWSVGAFANDASEQWVQSAFHATLSAPPPGDPPPPPTNTRVSTALSSENVYYRLSDGGSIDAAMAVTSVGADGFTCRMTDADGSRARWIWYLTFGPSAP